MRLPLPQVAGSIHIVSSPLIRHSGRPSGTDAR
jgi:hypothetical protein